MLRLASMLLLSAALAAAAPARAHHAAGPIKLAAILSLSGPAAGIGAPQLRTLQLYVERLNREGGLLTHPVELNYADDASDAGNAAQIARRLAVPEQADILIGGSITSTALAIGPVMQAAKIPFISLATGSRVTEPNRAWVFRTPPSESMAMLRILDDLARSGAKRVALLTMETESGRTARRDVRQYTNPDSLYFKKSGIALAADLAFPGGDATAAALAMEQASRAKDVQGVIAVAFGDAAVAIARRHRELGVKAQLYFSHSAATPEFLAAAGKDMEGLRIAVPPMLIAALLPEGDPQKQPILDYIADYRARYGDAPPPSGGYARDALMLAVNAIREGRSLDFNHMRQVLDGTRQFVGVTGTFNFWSTDHRALDQKSLRLVQVERGALRLLD